MTRKHVPGVAHEIRRKHVDTLRGDFPAAPKRNLPLGTRGSNRASVVAIERCRLGHFVYPRPCWYYASNRMNRQSVRARFATAQSVCGAATRSEERRVGKEC